MRTPSDKVKIVNYVNYHFNTNTNYYDRYNNYTTTTVTAIAMTTASNPIQTTTKPT